MLVAAEPGNDKPKDLLQGGAALHERMSRHIIENTDAARGVTHILKGHGFVPNEIGSIVVGESDVMLYNQLMHSDIDADQMDYLIRDATSLGIGYGQFAVEYLIECFQLKEFDGHDLLCIKEKGVHTVDHYLLAKYFYSVQILYHRTRWIVEEAAQKLYENMLDCQKEGIPSITTLPGIAKDENKWISFDDSWVMGQFRKAEQEKWLTSDLECLYDIILRRRIPDCTLEKTINQTKDGPDIAVSSCQRDMKAASPNEGTGLSSPNINLHHLTKKFTVVKTMDERRHEKGHLSEDAAMRQDRDIIRFISEDGAILPINKESASFAQYLQQIQTHVFRAYKLKPA